MCACSVAQSCPNLCNSMGSSLHGLLQASRLEWVAMPSSRDLPDPRIKPESPALQVEQPTAGFVSIQGMVLLYWVVTVFQGALHFGKELACNAGDLGLILGSGRSPGGGNGNLLQYSCLENPMDRGAWQATVHGVARVGHDLETKPPPPIFSAVSRVPYLWACETCRISDPHLDLLNQSFHF